MEANNYRVRYKYINIVQSMHRAGSGGRSDTHILSDLVFGLNLDILGWVESWGFCFSCFLQIERCTKVRVGYPREEKTKSTVISRRKRKPIINLIRPTNLKIDSPATDPLILLHCCSSIHYTVTATDDIHSTLTAMVDKIRSNS